jgi:prolyl oligopeptidase
MKNKLIIPILCASAIFVSCKKESNQRNIDLKYPVTIKKPVIDTLFKTAVVDNYRWLEDDRSKETEAWVKAENDVTFNYLNKIPYRDQLKARLSKLWNYEKVGTPFIEGDYTYFYKNDGLQNQYVVYRKKDGKEEVFLDPNTFSEDGTTSLGSLSFSIDGLEKGNYNGCRNKNN